MKEINKHILYDAVMGLSVHNAPSEVWDEIEYALIEIPSGDLPVHSPPGKVWNNVQSNLKYNKRNRIIRYSTIALLVLLSGLLTYYFTGITVPGTVPVLHQETTNHNPDPHKNSNSTPIVSDSDTPSNSAISKAHTGYEVEYDKPATVDYVSANSYSTITNTISSESGIDPVSYSISRISSIYIDVIDSQSSPILKEKNIDEVSSELPQDYCNFNYVEKDILLGFTLGSPFPMDGNMPADTKLDYWLNADIRANFIRNGLWFEMGLGVTISKDRSTFKYDYKTNELVDTYEYVDSVHVDPVTGQTHYYTTTVEVWDSIEYNSTSALNRSYTYAYIPLRLGYRFLRTKTLYMDISVGGNYFFEISNNIILPSLYHENSTIGNVENVKTIRRSQFYNLETGVGFGWLINDNLQLRLNPAITYFPESIYSDYNNSSVMLKISAGIYLKF